MKTRCNRQVLIADHRQTYAALMPRTPQIKKNTHALYETHPLYKENSFLINRLIDDGEFNITCRSNKAGTDGKQTHTCKGD